MNRVHSRACRRDGWLNRASRKTHRADEGFQLLPGDGAGPKDSRGWCAQIQNGRLNTDTARAAIEQWIPPSRPVPHGRCCYRGWTEQVDRLALEAAAAITEFPQELPGPACNPAIERAAVNRPVVASIGNRR